MRSSKPFSRMVIDHHLIPAGILLMGLSSWRSCSVKKVPSADELGNPALHLGPGQFHFRAFRRGRTAFAVAAAKLMGQPCGGIFFPRMVFM